MLHIPNMSPSERDTPREAREGENILRHQHSASSDHGVRSLVPMWDSSDPERAPPPLPLNPQSPSLSSRAGVSSAIQSAHAALSERVRESSMVPPSTKRMSEHSPERALIKGGSHRRMQSLQPGSVRDLSMMLEGSNGSNVSPPKSPEKQVRPSTPVRSRDSFSESRHGESNSASSTPAPGPSLTPIVRPTALRRPPQSILSENTPPQSSTMLALQNMGSHNNNNNCNKESDTPLSNITNGAKPQQIENLSSQILSLTSIATQLQKEMSQLSRRSRDNAADLLSLKEATSTRDEDIRKSLRDLLGNIQEGNKVPMRDPFGGLYLDNKPHNISPDPKPFHLPRIPSLKSFSESIDRASMSTPSLAGSEVGPSLGLLEKIIRDMGTKEGQEILLSRLAEISSQLEGVASAAKIDELSEFIKAQSERAVISTNSEETGDQGRSRSYSIDEEHSGMELAINNQHRPGTVAQRVEHFMKNEGRRASEPPGRGAELVNEDLMNIIRSVKDSVAQGGGLTAEVKALVRELRGEVLGMGREIGRRLEQQASRKSGDDSETPSKDEVARVIDEGLEQMKDQLNHVLREHRRQSASSTSSQKTVVDYQEIYNAMRAALRDNEASRDNMPDLSREDVIEAVRDAWENYKPEIEVQQLGLERDEVLACLKEGLREYAPQDERGPGATREEVFKAVVEGLKHFVPPQVETPASLSRDEIIEAVRDCLEEFEFPVAASAIGHGELTREDMVHAVKEGLHKLELPSSRALVTQSDGNEVASRLQDIMEYMKSEFAVVSREARENVAANGRDTEQVLDATKDGLETLRKAIEGYVDRAVGANVQEEFLDDMLKSLDDFRDEIAELVANATESSREQLKTELEGLREVVNSSMVPATPVNAANSVNHVEIIEALHTGLNSVRQEIHRPRAETSEVLDALNDGMNELRAGLDRVANKPMDLTANDEILEALRTGIDSVRADIESLRESTGDKAVAALNAPPPAHSEILDTLKSGLESLRTDIEALRDSSAEKATSPQDPPANEANKELQNALRTGLESVGTALEALRDSVVQKAAPSSDGPANEEILNTLKAGIESLRSDIEAVRDSNADKDVTAHDAAANDEALKDVKSGLDALRSDIEALKDVQADKGADPAANAEVLSALKSGLDSLRADIEALRDSNGDRAVATLDASTNSGLLDAFKTGLDAVRAEIASLRDSSLERALAAVTPDKDSDKAIMPPDGLTQDDIKNLEGLITRLQSKVEALQASAENNRHKDEVARLEEMYRNMQKAVDDVRSLEPSVRVVAAKDLTDLPEGCVDVACKDDVEAIETILRNTKDRLDDLMDGEQAVRKDHIDALEVLLLEAKETMTSVSGQMESISRKEDVAPLESLVNQVTAGFDELRERAIKESENPGKVSKADVQSVEAVVSEIKTALEGIAATDFAALTTKVEVAKLEGVVNEIKEKLEESKESSSKAIALLEESNESSFKAIALRDTDMTTVGERVNEVKTFLEEFQQTVKTKLEDGTSGVEALSKLLETMGQKIDKNENVGTDLKEMFDTMKAEFEDSKGIVAGAKLESDEKVQQATDNLGAKVDEKIGELVTKYDELQTMLDEKSKLTEARDVEMEAAVVGTKVITDELKLLVDTLGSTVTDSLEKMEEASKTVFEKVEEMVTKTDENHTTDKAEHQQTRDQLAEALTLVEGLKGEMGETHPKLLEAVKDILLLVGEHFEHSKTSITEIQGKIEEGQPSEHMRNLLPPEKYDNSEVLEKLGKLIEEKYDDSAVREQLDKVIEQKYDDTEVHSKLDKLIEEKYDDAAVHEKLDKLVEEKYDDTHVREKLDKLVEDKYDDSEVRGMLDKIIEEKYDDAAVREMLVKLSEEKYDDTEVRGKLDKIIEEKYDDAAVHEKLDKLREEKYDDAVVQEKLDKIIDDKYDDILIHEKLDKIIEDKYDDILVHEKLDKLVEDKYDDILVHEKLDKLVDHTGVAEQAFTQLATLDQVHQSVVKTAEEISLFLANQTQRVVSDNEEREKKFQETNMAIERKLAEKDHIEASVLSLKDEEERLRQSILALRTEQESLIRQKTRLTGDLSSLETAMRLRKEELYDMESRAEGLERRILEGVMDHSRVLLMSKARRAGGDAMSRKRVRKPANDGEVPQSTQKPAVTMALAAKRNLAPPAQSGAGRRIVSLSQINNNVASGGVKRSHSVRTPVGGSKAYRKSSWGGLDNDAAGEDKENMGVKETVEELEEPETPMDTTESEPAPGTERVCDEESESDTGTLRRESHGSTVVTNSTETDSESESDYSDEEMAESTVGAPSTVGSEAGHASNEVVM